MNRFEAYIRMALGLPLTYSDEQMLAEATTGDFASVDYVWANNPRVDEICAAWGIERTRFVRSFAAPKPSSIAHLVFNEELKRSGLEPLPDWPQGSGLIIPERRGKAIVGIKFMTLNSVLRPRRKQQAEQTATS